MFDESLPNSEDGLEEYKSLIDEMLTQDQDPLDKYSHVQMSQELEMVESDSEKTMAWAWATMTFRQ